MIDNLDYNSNNIPSTDVSTNQSQQPVYQDDQYQQPEYQDDQYQQPIYQDNQYQQPLPHQQVKKSGCSGCLKGCLISFVLFVIVVVLLVFAGKSLVKFLQPKPIETTQADVASFYEKYGVQNDSYTVSAEELLLGMFTSEGQTTVDQNFTNEEVTGALQDASKAKDVFKDYSVKFIGPDQVEFMTTISDQIEKLYSLSPELKNFSGIIDRFKDQTIYYQGEVTYDSSYGVHLNPEKMKIGLLPIPQNIVLENIGIVEELINTTINRIEGLTIESAQITEDGLDFKGTIPESLMINKEEN